MRTERVSQQHPFEAFTPLSDLPSDWCQKQSQVAPSVPVDDHGMASQSRADAAASDLRFFRINDHEPAFAPSARPCSPWTGSAAKRVFDCACVVLALPVLLPVLFVVGVAVGVTSRGPILFLQKRAGRDGRTFTIFKFRTMAHLSGRTHRPVTTVHNQRFTPIGRFLRRWKLDELPQLLNVLLGQMSLVGPRPKLPEHMLCHLACRPGLTSPATLAFAREESLLAHIPPPQLDAYYRDVVLPAKHWLDASYFAQATFFSDFALVVKTALRRWDSLAAERSLAAAGLDTVKTPRKPVRKEHAVPVVSLLPHLNMGDVSTAEEA